MKTSINHMMWMMAFLLLGVLPSAAQEVAQMNNDAFRQYVDMLYKQGQAAYLKSDRLTTKSCYEQMESAIDARVEAGKLSQETADSLMQYVRKLEGDYHYDNADYDKTSFGLAASSFMEALEYAESDEHPFLEANFNQCVLHMELSQLYYKQACQETDAGKRQRKFESALEEMQEAEKRARNWYNPERPDSFNVYFQATAGLAMCYARVEKCDSALLLIDELIEEFKDTDSERYGELLRRKAKIIMLQIEGGDTNASISQALDCYKRYFNIKRTDALVNFTGMDSGQREQYWMNIRPFVTDCYRLEEADPAFLYDVTLFAKGLLLQLNRDGGGKQSLNYTWQQIQQRLPADGCAIEFVQYEKGGAQHMGALVLGKTGQPRFVRMMAPEELAAKSTGSFTVSERLYVTDGKKKNELYNDTALASLIWNSQLIDAMGKAKKVYFAPDGYMHQIAVEYLLPQNLKNLSFYRLTSTRRLMDDSPTAKGASALILGGVVYATQVTGASQDNDTRAYDNARGLHFDYLKNSGREVQEIHDHRNIGADRLLLGEAVTEGSFRTLCSQFPILHISTHGVFTAAKTPQGTDLKPCLSDESLSQCFLALAGVQTAVDSPQYDRENQDGVLSAREMSGLDMSRVQLFVLACCETALGYVTSDGVYGIQRGLKNAGVGAIVATLWDIDDEAATMFMVALHDLLAKGQTIHQAFYGARQALLSTKMEDNQERVKRFNPVTLTEEMYAGDDYSDPRYVDAFILIDALD